VSEETASATVTFLGLEKHLVSCACIHPSMQSGFLYGDWPIRLRWT